MAKTSPHKLSAGDLLAGKYRLLRLLGEGAMSAVWAARNEATTGEVAIKIPHRVDGEHRQRLQREARAGATVKHRNVLEVHDIAQTESGDPFLVMQLLRGETLADLLARKRRVEAPEAARIARDVTAALGAAHAQGLVHRDLKPSNLFMHYEAGSPEPVVKVLDFGVARDLKGSDALQTAPGTILGTPHYMSPEQARAEEDIDPRSDLWSLGVILFEMLTGVRPFPNPRALAAAPPDRRTPSTGEVLTAILKDEIPRVSSLIRGADEALDRLVDRCLRRDRAERPASAAEVVAELDAWLARSGGPTSARSGGPTSARAPTSGSVAPSGTLVLGPGAPPSVRPDPPPRREPPPPPRTRLAEGAPTPPRPEGGTVRLGLPVPPRAESPSTEAPTGLRRGLGESALADTERRRSRVPLVVVTLLLLAGGAIAVMRLRPELVPPSWVAALPPALRPPQPPMPAPAPSEPAPAEAASAAATATATATETATATATETETETASASASAPASASASAPASAPASASASAPASASASAPAPARPIRPRPASPRPKPTAAPTGPFNPREI